MEHNQRMDSGERYAKRRPEELISKYEKVKNTLFGRTSRKKQKKNK